MSWQHKRLRRIVSVPMFRLAIPWRHLIKTTLYCSPNHGKATSSNINCINTQALKHKTPFRNCLLLTDVTFFSFSKIWHLSWMGKQNIRNCIYVIICFVCVLCTNIKYYPNPYHYPFSKFRFDLEFGGLQ